MGMKI